MLNLDFGVFLETMETKEKSALGLAFLGDAVFELFARSYIMSKSSAPVDALSKKTRELVNARSQSKMYRLICESLSEEELAVLKRGRNTKTGTTAKNATVSDYRHATGVEALFGYLFIKGDIQRLTQLFEICLEAL